MKVDLDKLNKKAIKKITATLSIKFNLRPEAEARAEKKYRKIRYIKISIWAQICMYDKK